MCKLYGSDFLFYYYEFDNDTKIITSPCNNGEFSSNTFQTFEFSKLLKDIYNMSGITTVLKLLQFFQAPVYMHVFCETL